MRKLLLALLLAAPLATSAIESESWWRTNAQNADFAAGKQAVAEKDWQAAVQAFSRAAKDDPRNPDVHNYLGYSYRNLGQMELSFRHYHEALRLDPDHRGANEYIGWAYLKTDQLGQAERHLAKLEKICGHGCEEYLKLSKGIADYRVKKAL